MKIRTVHSFLRLNGQSACVARALNEAGSTIARFVVQENPDGSQEARKFFVDALGRSEIARGAEAEALLLAQAAL